MRCHSHAAARPARRAPAATIFEGVVELIERHRPDVLAVEDVFYARNVRTTVVLGHARGVVLLAGARAGMPDPRVPARRRSRRPSSARGGATKEQVQFMVTRLLRLRTVPQPERRRGRCGRRARYSASHGSPHSGLAAGAPSILAQVAGA